VINKSDMIDLSKIISISGESGLFKVLSQTKTGMIVEDVTTKAKKPAFSTQKISSLEDISMFTSNDDKPLSEIMHNIYVKENGAACLSHKEDDQKIIAYFGEILPDYDKERVYVSNMKKLFQWYNTLQASGSLVLKEAEEETKEEKAAKVEAPKKTAKVVKPKAVTPKTVAGTKKTASVRKAGSA
jgi:hypothetical protein